MRRGDFETAIEGLDWPEGWTYMFLTTSCQCWNFRWPVKTFRWSHNGATSGRRMFPEASCRNRIQVPYVHDHVSDVAIYISMNLVNHRPRKAWSLVGLQNRYVWRKRGITV